MRTWIYLDKETRDLVDFYAKEHHLNRSEAIRWCIGEALKGYRKRV